MDLSKKKTLVIKNINDSSLTPKDLKWISKELKININELLESNMNLIIVEKKSYTEKLARLILICINLYIIGIILMIFLG